MLLTCLTEYVLLLICLTLLGHLNQLSILTYDALRDLHSCLLNISLSTK